MPGEDTQDDQPDGTSKSSSTRYPPRRGITTIDAHLKQPITDDETRFVLSATLEDLKGCKTHTDIKKTFIQEKATDFIYDVCVSPWKCLQSHLKNLNFYTDEEYSNLLKASIELALDNYIIHKSTINNMYKFATNKEYRAGLLQLLTTDPILRIHHRNKINIEIIKDMFSHKQCRYGEFIKVTNNVMIERSHFIFKCESHGTSAGPFPLFVANLDIIQTRFSLFMYWKLADYYGKYSQLLQKGISLFDHGVRVVNYIESLYPILGKNIFNLLKTWDSYVIGKVCADNVKDIGYIDLRNSVEDEIDLLCEHINPSIIKELWFFDDSDEGIAMALELSTLSRSFGHPCIEYGPGFHEVAKIAGSAPVVDHKFNGKVTCQFKKLFIEGYIIKNKKWPIIKFVNYPPPIIMDAYIAGTFIPKHLQKHLPLEAWSCIEFDKTFDYDFAPQTADLIGDTSCSPPLSSWPQMYDSCGFKKKYNKSKPRVPFHETRVFLRYLKGYSGETREAVERYNRGELKMDDLINTLCRKERELKEKGRLFTKATYLSRLVQTSSEANINKFINPNFRFQTMSENEVGLNRRINSMNRLLTSPDCENMNLDLWRWNLTNNHIVIAGIAKCLDDLFGMEQLYQICHLQIQQSYIMNNSRVNPPDIDSETGLPITGEDCYTNQYGGLEGMRQKLWTLITQCIIMLTAEELDIDVCLMGQGDNQVVTMKWKPFQYNDKAILRQQFLRQLKANFLSMNMVLKDQETWISNRLLEYGKSRWLNGVPVSNATKRAARIMSQENDGLSTLDSSLATISTATESIARQDWCPDISFIIYGLEVATLLFTRKIFTLRHTHLLRLSLYFWPNILGGQNLSSLYNHIVRGIDDNLTTWLAVLMEIKKSHPSLYLYVQRLIPLRKKNTTDLKNLIEDIYSLNITRLRMPSMIIKERVRDQLPNIVTNPEVSDLLNLDTSSNDTLMDILVTARPFYASILHEISRNATAGIIKNLVNRFTNVSSMTKLAQQTGSSDIYLEAIDADSESVLNLIHKCPDNEKQFYINNKNTLVLEQYLTAFHCPYACAKKMRLDSWGTDVVGSSHPFIPHQGILRPWDQLTDEEKTKSIHIKISQELLEDPSIFKKKLGPFPIYKGSNTPVKSIGAPIKLSNPNPFLKSLKSLLDLKSWIIRANSPHLITIIDKLIDEKMAFMPQDFDTNQLKYIADEVYGGCFFHRFRAITESRGALINYLEGITGYIKINTSNMSYYARGGADYSIFFQGFFLFIYHLISDIILIGDVSSLTPQMGMLMSCNDCTHEYEEEPITCSRPLPESYHDTIFRNVDTGITSYDAILLRSKEFTPLEVLEITSLCMGMNIGSLIESNAVSTYADSALGQAVFSPETHKSINIPLIRTCKLDWLLVGVISTSKILRDLIWSETFEGGSYLNLSSLKIIGGVLICAQRLNEFLNLSKARLTAVDDIDDNSLCESSLLEVFTIYLSRIDNRIIYQMIKYVVTTQGDYSHHALLRWYYRYLSKLMVNSINSSTLTSQDRIKQLQTLNNQIFDEIKTLKLARRKLSARLIVDRSVNKSEISERTVVISTLYQNLRNNNEIIQLERQQIITEKERSKRFKILSNNIYESNTISLRIFNLLITQYNRSTNSNLLIPDSKITPGIEEIMELWKINFKHNHYHIYTDEFPDLTILQPITYDQPHHGYNFYDLPPIPAPYLKTITVEMQSENTISPVINEYLSLFSCPFYFKTKSSSALLSLLSRLDVMNDLNNILLLGDHYGEITSIFLSPVYDVNIIMHHDMSDQIVIPYDYLNVIPACLYGISPALISRLLLNSKKLLVGDTQLKSEKFIDKLFNLNEIKQQFDIIYINFMTYKYIPSPQLIMLYINNCLLNQPLYLIINVKLTCQLHLLLSNQCLINPNYKIFIFKPIQYSQYESNCFIIITKDDLYQQDISLLDKNMIPSVNGSINVHNGTVGVITRNRAGILVDNIELARISLEEGKYLYNKFSYLLTMHPEIDPNIKRHLIHNTRLSTDKLIRLLLEDITSLSWKGSLTYTQRDKMSIIGRRAYITSLIDAILIVLLLKNNITLGYRSSQALWTSFLRLSYHVEHIELNDDYQSVTEFTYLVTDHDYERVRLRSNVTLTSLINRFVSNEITYCCKTKFCKCPIITFHGDIKNKHIINIYHRILSLYD